MNQIFSDQKRYSNEKTNKLLFCIKRRAPWNKQPDRKIKMTQKDKEVPNNTLETTQYNIFTFFPKNFMIQISKSANLYFVLMGVIQMIPETTTTGGVPLVYSPLALIITISMVKDFLEDWKRRKEDIKENNHIVEVLKDGQFVEKKSKYIRIGDIIKIHENQMFPADIVLLKVPNNKNVGYIETKNLDGETNLKLIKVHNYFQNNLKTNQDYYDQNLNFVYEKPSPAMYRFNGYFYQEGKQEQNNNFDINNFIYRGSSLRNTKWVEGLVVYNGHDSKIMLNSIKGKIKFSKIQKSMNRQIIWVFLQLISLCIFAAGYSSVWQYSNEEELTAYLGDISSSIEIFLLRIPQWFIILANFLPISLLVTLEMVKVGQSVIVQIDKNFLFKGQKALVNQSDLIEELGIVNYILSDKTGTLTSNLMRFKFLMAGKHTYGNKDLNEHAKKNVNSVVDFEDKKFTKHFSNKKFSNYFYIIESLKCINLCHSVHTDIEEKGIKYSASSPDEFALVNFAAEQGFQFEGKNENDIMQIRHGKHILKYKLLQLLEFSFERKRMSVIVKDLQTNQIIVYTKGADSKIHELIDKNWPHYQSHIDKSVEVLGKFSEKGLRTLCLSRRCLEIEEYEKWEKKYNEAKKSLDQDRKVLIEELEEEIESKSILLGATAIEDKLQDDIDVTIDYFTQAGIKTWMITGDKTETAVKIGINCQLINPNSKIMILNNESDLEAHYEEAINYYKLENKQQKKKKLTDEEKLQQEAEKYQEKKPELVIVLNGVVFECLKKQKKLNEFGKVLINCQTVIACRVTPKEKQEFVSLIKRIEPSAVTLAIGDGANDVSMITEAHVGVGIQGIEGREASKAGDFAIGQFKYLKRLLFYVGQESYRKNSQLIFYNFYKNQSWILVGFVFGFFSGFSGQYIYDQLILQFYNVFFCSLPIILFAFFDETYPTSKFLQFPQNESNQLEFLPLKFKQNYEQQLYCQKNFWINFFTATLHAILVTVITLLFLGGASPLQDQRQYDIYQIGMVIFTITVIFNNNRVFLYSHTHYFITIFCNVGSNFVYLGFLYYKSVQEESDSFGIFKIMYTSYNVYFAIIMSLVVTNLFDWGIDRYTLFFKQNPRYIQKEPVQEIHNKFLSLSPSKVGSSFVSSVVKSSQKFQKSGFFPANKQGLNTTLQSFSTQKFSIQNTSANSNKNTNLLYNQNLAIKKAHSNNQLRQGKNYLNSGNEVQSDMTQKQQQNPQKSEFSNLKSSAVQEIKQENHINENDEQQYLEEIKDDNNTQKYPEIYIGNDIVLKRQRQINGKNINLNPDENNKSDYLYNNSNNYLQNNSEGSNPEKSVISNHSSDSRLGHTQMALNIENDSNIHLKNSEDKYDIVIKTNNSKKSKFKNQQ